MIKEIIGSTLCITSMATCATKAPVDKEESGCLNNISGLYFNKFELGGHRYILFREPSHSNISVVHDPDCNCFENGKSSKVRKANGSVLL